MEGREWFKLFPADFLAGDLGLLGNEEFGALLRLLFHNWIAQTLPDSPLDLARLANCTPEAFERIWPQIENQFEAAHGRPGRITNPYLATWETHRASISKKKSLAGQMGGRPSKANAFPGVKHPAKQREKGPEQIRADQNRTEDPPVPPQGAEATGVENPKRKKPLTTIPEGFAPSEKSQTWFREKYGDIQKQLVDEQTELFIERCVAKGTLFVDWQAGWKTWIRNWMNDFGRKIPPKPLEYGSRPPGVPENDPNLVRDDDDDERKIAP